MLICCAIELAKVKAGSIARTGGTLTQQLQQQVVLVAKYMPSFYGVLYYVGSLQVCDHPRRHLLFFPSPLSPHPH